MTLDQVEEQLRRAGRPSQPPDRLRRAVLGIPGHGAAAHRRMNRWRAAPLASVAIVMLLAGGVFAFRQATAFHAVSTIRLLGANGGQAEARLGNPDGPNRPVQLVVQHLDGQQGAFELWSFGERPPMMLTTFMTSKDGSCTITLSVPTTLAWSDLVITPRDDPRTFIMCSDHGRC